MKSELCSFRQMCIVVSCDCFTGVFAGFAVFATIGFLAASLNEPVSTFAESSGPGLAFITYPQALSQMPANQFFSVIFFLMLLALGLGSQVCPKIEHRQNLSSVQFTFVLVRLNRRDGHRSYGDLSSLRTSTKSAGRHRLHSVFPLQFTVFLSRKKVSFVCHFSRTESRLQGGIYLFELFQEYTANTSLVVIGFFEVSVVAFAYGLTLGKIFD